MIQIIEQTYDEKVKMYKKLRKKKIIEMLITSTGYLQQPMIVKDNTLTRNRYAG